MTHTPGPWQVFVSEPNRIQTTDGVHIADVYMVGKDSKHDNARLIATAPELLEALLDLIADFEELGAPDIFTTAHKRAREAIAKVKA